MSEPLRITAIEVDGTVTRPLRFAGPPGDALAAALREAMLKRGCLRDRAHKGQCMSCALLPRCAVWPLVAPADPTQRQRGPFLRPFALRLPEIEGAGLPVGARVTYGMTLVQDPTFPFLWGVFAGAFVQAARQIAEWGFGLAVREGEQAARRGAISVGRVRWVQPITGESEPFAPPDGSSPQPPLIATFTSSDTALPADEADALILTFLTPTRLVARGATLSSPDLAILFQRIAERLDAVAEAIGVTKPDLLGDTELVAAVARLAIADDHTRYVGDAAKGGFTGVATFTGSPEDRARVAAALHWGAALGVGKGTLHGLGRFVVGPVPPSARIVIAPDIPQSAPVVPRKEPARTAPKAPVKLRHRTARGNRTR